MPQSSGETMTQSHYSLRWNNHQNHMLAAFEALLQAETLVDVTLVCDDFSIRAHKVVLTASSPLFQKIFADNPCDHPVIVLKDFEGELIQLLVDFMYRGEISVSQEHLQNLMKAAENLQVRGLAPPGRYDKPPDHIVNRHSTPTPSASPDLDKPYFTSTSGVSVRSQCVSPLSYEPPVKLPHMSRLSFPDTLMPRQECQSPITRRKQARPRRRSGEICIAQDLSKSATPPIDETPENLSMKKTKDERSNRLEEEKFRAATTRASELPRSPELDLSLASKEFRPSPPVSLPPLNMKHEIENHSPLSYPPMPSVSALAMTPPHSKFFGLDSPLGLFPSALENCRNPLFDLPDPRTTPDSQLYAKKKMGRPKGQHSAPRGGPPRSWTNAELTEALQHVWNKKMTTSQASRIFGIPYNSLLMYVRGKYGKSLKLEQLRKDCIGGPPNSSNMDLLNMPSSNNNNNSLKNDRSEQDIQPTRPSSNEPPQPPLYNPFGHGYYPDYNTFPIPVSMIHLLPQSEKIREHYVQQSQQDDDCSKSEEVKNEMEEDSDVFRPPTLSVDGRRELVQQNGQD